MEDGKKISSILWVLLTAAWLATVAWLWIGSSFGEVPRVSTSSERSSGVVVVTGKERVVSADVTFYLVYTRDASGTSYVFANADDRKEGKTDSGNIQESLDVGSVYHIQAKGIRRPELSEFPNIINADLIYAGETTRRYSDALGHLDDKE